MKKETNVFFLSIVTLLLLLIMSSCESNTPSHDIEKSTDERSYCNVIHTNATKNYCAIIYIDGVSIKTDSGDDYILWAGKSISSKISDFKYPVDLKVELHEISSENKYYTKVAAEYYKKGYTFNPNYDYKVIIGDDGVTIYSVKK